MFHYREDEPLARINASAGTGHETKARVTPCTVESMSLISKTSCRGVQLVFPRRAECDYQGKQGVFRGRVHRLCN